MEYYDAEREELEIEYMSRYDDQRERYAGSALDNVVEAMCDDEWEGTREEYLAELDRRSREARPLFQENERVEGVDALFGDDDIPF